MPQLPQSAGGSLSAPSPRTHGVVRPAARAGDALTRRPPPSAPARRVRRAETPRIRQRRRRLPRQLGAGAPWPPPRWRPLPRRRMRGLHGRGPALLSPRKCSRQLIKARGRGRAGGDEAATRPRPPPSPSHDACLHSASTSAASGRGAACGPSAARRLSGREPARRTPPSRRHLRIKAESQPLQLLLDVGHLVQDRGLFDGAEDHPHHLGLDLDRGQHGDRQAVRDLLGGTSTRTVLVDLRKPEGAAAERLVERGLCEWGAPFEDGDQLSRTPPAGSTLCPRCATGSCGMSTAAATRLRDGRARGVPPGAVAALG